MNIIKNITTSRAKQTFCDDGAAFLFFLTDTVVPLKLTVLSTSHIHCQTDEDILSIFFCLLFAVIVQLQYNEISGPREGEKKKQPLMSN